MDIYQFVDSKDIREHCRKLGHPFNTVESAYLVWRSCNTPLTEKYEIIDTICSVNGNAVPRSGWI